MWIKGDTVIGEVGRGRHKVEGERGVYLVVQRSGSRSWIYRQMVRGRSTDMGLGGWPDTSMEMAIAKAAAMRRKAESKREVVFICALCKFEGRVNEGVLMRMNGYRYCIKHWWEVDSLHRTAVVEEECGACGSFLRLGVGEFLASRSGGV